MFKSLLMGMVRGYQKYISPLFPPTCRYYPTCSHYTLTALEKHGALKGGIMGVSRIIRCNPFVDGGIDKVPDHFTLRRNPKNKNQEPVILNVHKACKKDWNQSELDKKIDSLLNKYQEKVVVKKDEYLLPLDEELIEKFPAREISVDALPQEYLINVEEQIDLLSEVSLKDRTFKLFEIEETKQTHSYFHDLTNQEINQAILDGKSSGQKLYVLLEKDYGLYQATSPSFARDFILQAGIGESDIDDRTDYLLEYLFLLDQF